MKPGDAWRVHAAVSHALLDVWAIIPVAQEVLQDEIEAWSKRKVDTADAYLALIVDRLASAGAEPQAMKALENVAAELGRIDGYLDSMFEKAVSLVSGCYRTWADWNVAGVRLEKAAAAKPVYPDPVKFGKFGVVACVPPREGTDPTIVKLTFVPRLLGPPSWATIPYLLCHELVCHANQAAPMSTCDAFAEGWMDLVALRLHHEWAVQMFPWAPSAAREAAEKLSSDVLDRWPDLPEPHMSTRGVRYQGRLAAMWVEEILEPFHDPGSSAPELIRLSLQLNRTSPTLAGRLDFIAKVLDGKTTDKALKAKLLLALRRWCDGDGGPGGVLSFA